MKTIFFDTETTGLNFRNCKIIELAMLTVEDGMIVDEYDEFIDVGKPLSPKIKDLTGITDEMIRDYGVYEYIVAEDLKEKMTPGTLMIAHNCQFDLMFVYNLLKRHFPDDADDIVANVDWLDTVSVLKDRKEYPHKLIDAVEYYELEEVNFHRAIDDTKALYEVTIALKKERNDLKEYVNIFGYNPKYGVSGVRFPFIEYKPQFFHNGEMLPECDTLPKK